MFAQSWKKYFYKNIQIFILLTGMAASRLLRVCGPRAPMFAFLGFAYAGKILLKRFTMSYFTATATEFHLSVKGKKWLNGIPDTPSSMLLVSKNPQKLQ